MRRIPSYGYGDRGPLEFKSRLHREEGEVMKIANRDVVTATSTTPILKIVSLMVKNKIRRVPIVQTGTKKIEGIVRSRDVISFLGGGKKHEIVQKKFAGSFYSAINEPVRVIMERDFPKASMYIKIPEAAGLLLSSGHGGLILTNEKNEIAGVVTDRDFVKFLPERTGYNVGYYMTRRVVTVEPSHPILEVMKRIIDWNVRRLPVVENGKLVGIITSMDILKYFGTGKVFEYLMSQKIDDVVSVPVEEIMTRNVLKISPEADIGEAATLMREKGCGGLPVVSDDMLVGIITERDILRLMV
ncbi:MAG: CBS domain-containing protein [Candidatus Hadarchaeales archaeon]